ncbi:ribonucleotide reductase inhibitor-domain-containing protein [Lasiosphaeria hispida]|uniref:Ribonucleotide reductase inhibitor-domain-containing protein n=1 Tax=Lasiosphaeria hispida TaxID=260671 RepID=A0AAJ0HVE5_9PEZI|nr:ribonucleotide reductase inhibitor-domain-containing protein [Lasiosphaeria hispida]
MSGPRTKRQFAGASSDPAQRQITSFFNKTPSNGSSTASSVAATTPPLNGPELPHHVQSNLISVGMRVRKSVPEGYKTGTYSGFSLWTDNPDVSALVVAATPSTYGTAGVASSAGGRELVPFCGIHKVGGLAVQPGSADADVTSDYYPMSGLTSSQDSIVSTSSTTSATAAMMNSAAANRKRYYIAEEDEEDGASANTLRVPHGGLMRNRDDWLDGEISPRSLAPAGWEKVRVLAVPKPRRRGSAQKASSVPPASGSLAELGQENITVDDFEEAPFLDYGMDGDMDME